MTQGDTITFDGQQLLALSNPDSSCQNLPLSCALYFGSFSCRGIELLGYTPCGGYDVIFVSRQKYLEMKPLGETR